MSATLGMAMLFSTAAVSDEKQDRSYAVYNKLKLFSWLVNDSPTMQRVIKSEDASAIEQLNNARRLLQQAETQFDDGEYELAEQNISVGIKEMSSVSQKIKDEDRLAKQYRKLYDELHEHIQVFVDAFERIAREKNEAHITAMLDREKLDGLLAKAASLYNEGEFSLANHQLKEAVSIVESALSDARHKDVLLHEISFDSAGDEYLYEKKRNESYVILIGLLQDKENVAEASKKYIDKIVTANKDIVTEAENYAARGDNEKAISILEQGTDKLARALRMSGVPF